MISDIKLKLILELYKNEKLTFEQVKTLIQEEPTIADQIQPINPWINPNPWGPLKIGDVIYTDLFYTTS